MHARLSAFGVVVLALSVSLSGLAQQPKSDGTVKPVSDPTVYVTKTGKKYHASSCRTVQHGSRPMKLSEAVKIYGRCGVCSPAGSLASAPPPPVERVVLEAKGPNAKSAPARDTRCQAVTKAGSRCMRRAQARRNYCWQHP